jgi:hypothetical protein
MTTLEKLEAEVTKLPADEFAKFRAWIEEYENMLWDQQIESDTATGKFDDLIAEAKADRKSGKAREL